MTFNATLLFESLEPDMQSLNAAERTINTRIFFSLQILDKRIEGSFVDITVKGASTVEETSIHVGTPRGIPGTINQRLFEQAVDAYVRNILGSAKLGVRLETNQVSPQRPQCIDFPMSVSISIDTQGGGW